MGEKQYKAFISYSHKDKKWASWLHKRLEYYRFPKHMIGQSTQRGAVPKNLKPIFKDREDLSAAENLGETIQAALSQSENLVIICSPHAAQSHWVNKEICYFKSQNPAGKVFSIIIDGEPFAAPDEAGLECLPPALRFDVDAAGQVTSTPAEPLAADLRPKGDGKRLGLLKLISGIAGLGLDDLVQRDLKRARHRVMAVTVSAATIVLSMGGLSWLALDASRVAETRKGQAENLIEYMIGDLKDKLEPVGRVDVLDGVAGKVIDYYNSYEPHEIDCKAQSRRAHALHVAAEVSLSTDNMEEFSRHADEAYAVTEASLKICKNKESHLFDHGQSAFWKGYVEILQNNAPESHVFLKEYRDVASALTLLAPANEKYQLELGSANLNLGAQYYVEDNWDAALTSFEAAESIYHPLHQSAPHDLEIIKLYAGVIGWKARIYWQQKESEKAKQLVRDQISLQTAAMATHENKDWNLIPIVGENYRTLARYEYLTKDYDTGLKEALMAEKTLVQVTQHDENNIEWQKELAYSQIIMLHILRFQNNNTEYQNVRRRLDRTLKAFQDTPHITEASMTDWLRLNSKQEDTP